MTSFLRVAGCENTIWFDTSLSYEQDIKEKQWQSTDHNIEQL